MVVTSAIQRAASARGSARIGGGAEQRHEGDKAERSARLTAHLPIAMNQVASATTPSSIARA